MKWQKSDESLRPDLAKTSHSKSIFLIILDSVASLSSQTSTLPDIDVESCDIFVHLYSVLCNVYM